MAKAEKPGASRKDASDLRAMAATLEKDSAAAKSPADGKRMTALAAILKKDQAQP
jgi:hypothetical protein